MKTLHRTTGILIALFVVLHLVNHAFSFLGAGAHIETMNQFRLVYRNFWVESLLMLSVLVQIGTGLAAIRKGKGETGFEKLQRASGFYLALFFGIHLTAVWVGRHFLKLDTNLYFGVVGMQTFPFSLFFVPYYGLAIFSFFAHLAAIHGQKMKRTFLGLSPAWQAKGILTLGLAIACMLIFGLSNGFQGFEIPAAYQVLVGK